ncbi:YhgE/Pip family protein [uncultured Friedmanniella sp.]|uniref:YhgE/Pip domain-containing protein n=1 Tax=uncultured Friedmanniella sp. TaxID=335381 RepID=UPI0035CC0878
MRIPAARLARFELRRFRERPAKIALVFVLIIPLLYGAVYLTANWDPYGHLNRLPVAVVNDDQPATIGGRTVTAGDDFVASLHQRNTFDWRDTTDAEATRGLREGDYYLAVYVPSDFSSDLVSGQGDDPERATITLRRNDANGFVIGSLTNSAQNTIARSVDESAVASYFDAVFANLAKIRSGLVDAQQGADKLHDGLATTHDGSAKLADGASTAADGATSLSTGATTLADGLSTARTGSSDLATGLQQLDTSSGQLSTGAAQVAAGNKELNDQVQPALKAAQAALPGLQSDAQAVTSRLDAIASQTSGESSSVTSNLDTAATQLAALKRQYPEIANSQAFRTAQSSVSTASGRADDIAADVRAGAKRVDTINDQVQTGGTLDSRISTARKNLDDLADGSADVASGAKKLHTGIHRASTGADKLSIGVGQAADGATSLASGASTLSDGVGDLHEGADDLTDGLTKLQSGAGTLATQLGKGADRIPTLSADDQAQAVQVLSAPADVAMQIDNPATFYGRGLAPLFFSIAMWVFGISVFLVVRPISGRALAGRASSLRLALTAWLPIGAIAVAAGWLMVGVVWVALGLDPVHPVLTMLMVTLAAICFSAIAHLLRTALGTPGSSLLLVLLILQLTAAGGTYPPELLPGFFAMLHPFLPMTYLIDAYRVAISGGLLSHVARDAGVLAAVTVVVLSLTVLTVHRRKQFGLKDLHPPLVAP